MSTGARCTYKHGDGSRCGLPIHSQSRHMCKFHSSGLDTERKLIGGLNSVFEYARQSAAPVNLSGIRFENVTFSRDTFPIEKSVDFRGASFKNCTFDSCTLMDADFSGGCQFVDTYFKDCCFPGRDCSFAGAQFDSDSVVFSDCEFITKVIGKKIDWSQLSFRDCRAIVEHSLFAGCTINAGTVNLGGISLQGKKSHPILELYVSKGKSTLPEIPCLALNGTDVIMLDNLNFWGVFRYHQYSGSGTLSPFLLVTADDFSAMASAQFHGASLEMAHFSHSNLEGVDFYECTFRRSEGRNKLMADDYLDKNSVADDCEELIRLYVQLKKNYESSGDFVGAGDWHYREMETRRKRDILATKGLRRFANKYISLISLYKAVSDYGQNYSRSLRWIVGLWFLFSWIYFFAGFAMSGNIVNYDFCWCNLSTQHFIDFAKSMLCSLSVMSFQAGRLIIPDGAWSGFWQIVQLVCTTILVPLFLLAVRRKFKR